MPKVDPARRRRIMQRSQRLGHCICDPRKGCPCDVFASRGLCPCAGERPEAVDLAAVRLTEHVKSAGCASKIAPADLEEFLARLPKVLDPAVLCGIPAGDDAAVYRLPDGTHLVQTVDVMTPCCDDPGDFGRVCAANCLSDVYAMGGVPRTALSILAFPSETLDGRLMYEMLRGAMAVLAEASCALVGGHSIKDEEIKLGFAITGTVAPGRVTARDAAAPGDVLVLTKPLGTGVLSFARQVGRPMGDFSAAVDSMAATNRAAAEAGAGAGVSACTDVTGFGLFGHLIGMARHSGVTAEVWAEALPALGGALEALAEGIIPGAVERNSEYVGADIEVADGAESQRVLLGFDAQTSGGLLLCVAPDRLEALLADLASRGVGGAAAIGRIREKSHGRIIVTQKPSSSSAARAAPASPAAAAQPRAQPDPPPQEACCPQAAAHGSLGDAEAAFASLMKAAAAPGAIDARTKELIQFALAVQARCSGCVEFHRRKAARMGIGPQELEEAAWLAVAMGGAPVRMFLLEAGKDPSDKSGCP